jgi:hypothetical protein
MPGTFWVPGNAGGQPLTDLDPRQSQPEQLFAFDKQAGVRHLGTALLLDVSITAPAWLGFALQRRGFFLLFIILVVDMWDNVGYMLFV